MAKSSVKYILFTLLLLSGISFFNPLEVISPQLTKLIQYIVFTIALIVAIIYGVPVNTGTYPSGPYMMIIGGIIMSIFMASLFHDQGFGVSVTTTLPYLFGYLSFYIFMKLNIPKAKVLNFIWVLCFISMVAYAINLATFPNMIFGTIKDVEEYDDSRGFLRLSIYCLELIVLMFLFSINRWLLTNQKKYLLLICLTGLFIILSLSRQYILISAILAIWMLLKNSSWIKKIIVIISCVAVIYFVVPYIPIFDSLMDVTQAQVERSKNDEEDVRIRAWRFYTYQYQTNAVTPFLGNGIPSMGGRSNWGNKFEQTVSSDIGGNGCYAADVGWAGFFWYFGLIATSGLFMLLMKAIKKKKRVDEQYLTYWCLFIMITSVASAPIIYYHQVLSVMSVLYLIYGKNESYSNNNIKLQ